MVVQCCQCKKIRVTASHNSRTGWIDGRNIEILPAEISHGYCPACASKAFAEIRAYARGPRLLVRHA
jgi:hypothetical protein